MPELYGKPFKREIRSERDQLSRSLWNERKEHMVTRRRLRFANAKIEELEAKLDRIKYLAEGVISESNPEVGKLAAERLSKSQKECLAERGEAASVGGLFHPPLQSPFLALHIVLKRLQHGLINLITGDQFLIVLRVCFFSKDHSFTVHQNHLLYVERQNLMLRTTQKRFARPTNGFSKKLTNHAAAVSCTWRITTSAAPTRPCGRRQPLRLVLLIASGPSAIFWTPPWRWSRTGPCG